MENPELGIGVLILLIIIAIQGFINIKNHGDPPHGNDRM